MEYMLTKDDIAKLVAAGLPGAMEGEIATPEDLQALGVTPQDTPEAPAITDDRSPGGNLAVEVMPASPAVTTAAPVASNANILQQLMATQAAPDTPTDPYANLSKNQRRMLAFSALSDAGAALAGRQGGNFNALLGRFNDQADMQRKATAAAQRAQAMGTLGLGGAGASREAILGAAAQGFIDGPTAKLMIEELERKEGKSLDLSSKKSTIYLIEALLNDPDLGQVLGLEGSARSLADAILPGAQEKYNELKSRVDQLRGGIFTEAFKSLRGGGQITEKEGEKASAALARLDTAQGVEAFKQALKEYQFYIRQGIARLEGQAIPLNTFFEGPGGGTQPPLSDADLDNLYPPTPAN